MDWDWHGATLFNLRSPSSHPEIVTRIIEEFVLPRGPSARILDVGGTKQGFVAHLGKEHQQLRSRVYMVNPRGGREIAYRDVSEIPEDTEPFDLAMMFGVMVYLPEPRLMETFRRIRHFLRPGGALIVADPNGGMCVNHLERPIKPIFGLPSNMYTETDTIRLMRAAGFGMCKRRPDLSGSRRYLAIAAYKRAAQQAARAAPRPPVAAAGGGGSAGAD